MLRYYGFLLLSAVAVSSAPILVRISEVTPTATLWLRMGIALLILLTPIGGGHDEAATNDPALHKRPKPAALLLGIVLSGFLFCGDMLANHWAVRMTSVANTTLLMNLTPVFVVVIAYLFLRERQSMISVAGVIAATAGALVLVGASYTLGRDHLIGDGLALSSALLYATFMVLTKALRNWVSATRLLRWHTGLSCLFLIPLVAGGHSQVFPVTLQGWAIVVGLAVVSQLIGHGLMTYAVKHVSAGISSMSTLIIPVLSALMAWVLLDEAVEPHHLLGGGLVLVGIGLYALHDLRAQKGQPA
jgi:drug/metabolite transporter (DMT)-like permease